MKSKHLFLASLLVCASAGLTQTATITPLYTFDSLTLTQSDLIQASDGKIYGTTLYGGADNYGSVFSLTTSGELTTLYSFTNGSDGSYPYAGLIEGGDGNFYGVAYGGGEPRGFGTVFKITPTGALTTLYKFTGGTDGAYPESSLVLGSDGNFYGTNTYTNNGNPCGCNGSLFKITPSGSFTALHVFQGGSSDGLDPVGIVQATDGDFYGSTYGGGVYNSGIVYKMTPSGSFTKLYDFNNGNVSMYAEGTPVEGSNGNLYNTTYGGGSYGQGIAYAITSGGAFTTLVNFSSSNKGIILASDGNFYGNSGGLFKVSQTGLYTAIPTTGGSAGYPLIQGSDGSFYASNPMGGADNGGTVDHAVISPSLSGPIGISVSSSSITLGQSANLSWNVGNAFSTTFQQCYAFVQGSASGAGSWTGKQTGSLSNGLYSGSATLVPTALGTYTYALTCGGQESGFATLQVGRASSTGLGASPNPATVGQNVTLTATVTGSYGTPTGSVSFYENSSYLLGTSTLNGSGVATYSASTVGLNTGTYAMTAVYGGNATYNPSTSSVDNVTLNKASTATSLTASPNPVTPPAIVLLTATVTRTVGSGAPGGAVSFYYGSTLLGTSTLNGSGVATLNYATSGLSVGTYPITATYNGNSNNNSSSSPVVNVVVE
jgi:uncharacterized repeat protein (TIGR03803 family)